MPRKPDLLKSKDEGDIPIAKLAEETKKDIPVAELAPPEIEVVPEKMQELEKVKKEETIVTDKLFDLKRELEESYNKELLEQGIKAEDLENEKASRAHLESVRKKFKLITAIGAGLISLVALISHAVKEKAESDLDWRNRINVDTLIRDGAEFNGGDGLLKEFEKSLDDKENKDRMIKRYDPERLKALIDKLEMNISEHKLVVKNRLQNIEDIKAGNKDRLWTIEDCRRDIEHSNELISHISKVKIKVEEILEAQPKNWKDLFFKK